MSGSPSLRELIDTRELQSIQDGFARTVGISSVILSPEGEPLTRFTNPTGFCSLIQSTEKGKERCFRSFMEMAENALGAQEPEIAYCFAGGGHFVAPIIVDGEHKGTMFAGQFIPEKFSSKQLRNLEEIAPEIDLDPELLVKEARKMRVVGEDAIRNYSSLLFNIVEIITKRGAQAAELGRAKDALQRSHNGLEMRYGDITEAMSDWVWEVDADARYTYCSEKVTDVLGYSAEEMIGKTPFDFMAPDEKKRLGAVFAEIFSERRPFKNTENWIRTRDGQSACMLSSGVPIIGDAGELLGYRGVESDITERKKEEEVLRATEERLRMMFDGVSSAIAVYDAIDSGKTFIFKDFNKAAEKLEKVKREDLIGRSVLDVFPGVTDFGLFDVFQRVWQTGEPEHFPVSFYRDERISGWRENYVYKLPSGEIVTIYKDITEQKEAGEALKYRAEYKKIVATISTSFITLAPGEIDAGIDAALRSIGEFIGVDRSYVFQFSDDGITMDRIHEWCADGVVPQIENSQGLLIEDFSWLADKLNRFETVYIPSVADLPADAGFIKENLQSQGVTSIIRVPMIYGGTLIGCIWFESMRQKRIWSEDDIAMLRIVGEFIANILARKKGILLRRRVVDALRESEEKIRAITDSANDAIVMMDDKARITYWNPAAERIFGCTKEEVIGKDLHETLVPERFHNDFSKGFERFVETGHGGAIGQTLELSAVRKDGTEFPVELSLSAVKLNGKWNAAGLIRDITERKIAEERLKSANRELKTANQHVEELLGRANQMAVEAEVAYAELDQIFNSAASGMCVIDRDFNVIRINERFSTMFGVTRDMVVGKKCFEVLRGPLCHTPNCSLMRILDGEERVECEMEKECSDGTRIPCILTTTPFLGLDNELTGIIEDFVDITERKRAEVILAERKEKLEETNRKLEWSNRDLQDFVYVVSHDLQEPVRKISAFGKLLKDSLEGRLDEDEQENFEFVIDGATRMQQMINDLLLYSRVTTKAKPLERVDLNRVIEDLKNVELGISLEETGGTIHIPEPLLPVQADPVQIHQLLQNLIGNGLKYHRKGVTPEITIRSKQGRDNMVRVEVTDNGIGIDSEYYNKIFKMFQRLHPKGDYEGTGIGLAVCEKIVRRHRGVIGVDSTPGVGSTFWFTLPKDNIERGVTE